MQFYNLIKHDLIVLDCGLKCDHGFIFFLYHKKVNFDLYNSNNYFVHFNFFHSF